MASKRPSKPEPGPLPDFTSDRLRLLRPLVTPRALELAYARILAPKDRLVLKGRKFNGEDPAVVKVALMLVEFLNPDEALTTEEEGVRRGTAAKTVGKRKATGEI